ncbi:MAG: EFR1 family ferrodoxin [Lachnospiraceae bacterium]|nr:EFR1 family ferrodoxin [Lachnospiraceae bacterium]
MIFYFSGTGNSYATALELSKKLTGESEDRLFDIAKLTHEKKYEFALEEGEKAGFVFPVYFGGLPAIVGKFIEKLQFEKEPEYLYGALTYGGFASGAAWMLEQALLKSGLKLNAAYKLKMPENYLLAFPTPSEESVNKTLDAAETALAEIVTAIEEKEDKQPVANPVEKAASTLEYPLYYQFRKTKPFYADAQCVHCGACAARCPARAIKMVDGIPTWVKEKCVFCMSCVRCGAIQYGDKLRGKKRYKHPILQSGAAH